MPISFASARIAQMMLKLEFTDTELAKVQQAAEQLGVPVEELAKDAVFKFVAENTRDFDSAAEYVLSKNEEL